MSNFFPQDDDAEFWESMGQIEEPVAASEEETPAEDVVVEEAPAEGTEGSEEADTAEEAKDERPRDEQGRFVKQETAEEETAAEQAERLFAGKYKSPDELEAAYAELQSRFGQQGSELGELRQALEERLAGLEQAVTKPQAPSSWEDLIEEDPAQALELAHQQGDQFNMRRAAIALQEVSPGYVAMWSQNKQMEQRLAEIEQRTQPVLQQSEAQARDQVKARAFLSVKSRNPDFDDYIPAIQQIAAKYPPLVTAVETGTPDEIEAGWQALLDLAKAGRADTLQQTAQQVARNALEGEQRAREEAVVASASSVKTEQPRKSAADLIGEEWEALEKPLSDGWNLS